MSTMPSAQVRAVLECMADAIVLVDDEGRVAFVNTQAESLFLSPRSALVGQAIDALVPDIEREGRRADRARDAVDSPTRQMGARPTLTARRPDGTDVPVDVSLSSLHDEGRSYVLACARDITERVVAETERVALDHRLRQAERMEALGRLAGGVAHDFNNFLTVILGFCGTALNELPQGQQVRRDVEEIEKAGRRAADLAQQLLAFSLQQVIEPRVVDLNAHLASLEEMLRRTVTEQVDVVFDLAPQVWPVYVDPSQIDQIVINLAANSRDAMPGGGITTVVTENLRVDGATAEHPGLAPGLYVRLAVSDSGTGMDEATRTNAFVPFFTTKAEGRGSGIGLASVYGIVKQNRGFVRIDSALGAGTTVHVFLPRAQIQSRGTAASAPVRSSKVPNETVLIVEDDDQTRLVIQRVLSHLGYTVLEAGSPAAAIAVCGEHSGPVHLALIDLVLPEMRGTDLARMIRDARPGTALLFMSGYARSADAGAGASIGTPFLPKPFDHASLTTAVRHALESPHS